MSESNDPGSTWDRLPIDHRRALERAWVGRVPTAASALHARWWQFESWLRSLCYVELNARYGKNWVTHLPATNSGRGVQDRARHTYMSTPDATDHLAYLDIGELFQLVLKHWDLFKMTLIDQVQWHGRVDELNKIRRRIAHCRRPHSDDLDRIEQTLRDLEGGAFRAFASFNLHEMPPRDVRDPMVEAWVRDGHPNTDLIKHARDNYDVGFMCRYSRRPWAGEPQRTTPVSGTPGCVWHADWILDIETLNLTEWWGDTYLDIDGWRDHIIYACASTGGLSLSLAAVDDPAALAKGLRHCFEAVIHNQSRLHPRTLTTDWDTWYDKHADLDPRVQLATSGWTAVSEFTRPVSIFGA